MYKILVPTDGSELSQQAVKQGMVFAKALHAKVFGLHVIPAFHAGRAKMDEGFEVPASAPLKKRFEEESKARALDILAPIEEEAKGAGLEYECIVGTNDAVYEEIIDTAGKKNCDLIMMASHGHAGITGLLLGSETAKLLTHAKLPVLVLR